MYLTFHCHEIKLRDNPINQILLAQSFLETNSHSASEEILRVLRNIKCIPCSE
jgi:hypothetical protein